MENETDLNLEEIPSEQEDLDIDDAPYEIRTYGSDLTLELYVQKIESGEIIIPPFQRKYVWPVKKASKLIESFLLDLPVPQVFLFRDALKQELLVVDGQQRLRTAQYFIRGLLEDGRTPFVLSGVRQRWNDKTFSELSEEDKRRLRNYTLRATIFEQVNPADNKSIYEIFERLNTGGMPLNEQEVRSAIVRGNIGDFLDELNIVTAWRALLGKPEPDRRKKDVEMILRVFALVYGWESYEKPMKDFITEYMRSHAVLTDEQKAEMRELWLASTRTILEAVGVSAFKAATGRLNIAILDALMVATILSRNQLNVANLASKVEALKQDPGFLGQVFQATTNVEVVKGRIALAMSQMSE